METVYIGLGSNLGARESYLNQGVERLAGYPEIKITKTSSIYETSPWGITGQPDFLNCVIELETTIPAAKLLEIMLDIEKKLHRERKERWGPRTIDLDILLYGNQVIHTPDLIVPHPRMLERGFVMIPLNEISPDVIHPLVHKPIKELLLDFSSERIRIKSKLSYFN